MNCTARFRDLTPITAAPAEGGKPWIHIAPRGEFPGTIEIPAGYDVPGYGVMESPAEVAGLTVITDENLERMVQGFSGDVLIDYEHFSHDKSKSTEAAGWGHGLRHTAARDGLEMETAWAAPARRQVSGNVYRYISPEFAGAVRYEDETFKFYPTALTGAGLTNRPQLKALRPVSANRETTNTPTMNHKSALCKILGLPDTASDDEITAKLAPAESEMATSQNRATQITALQTERTALQTELKALRDAAIESDIERFANVIEDKESARELLQLNRDTAVKFFTAAQAKVKAADAGTPPIYQRNRATAPDGAKFTVVDEDKNEIPRMALVATVKNREKCSFETAWTIAAAEKPELF